MESTNILGNQLDKINQVLSDQVIVSIFDGFLNHPIWGQFFILTIQSLWFLRTISPYYILHSDNNCITEVQSVQVIINVYKKP